ncbi:lysophospholipase L1-like esterase [Gracilibacillus halotolerans]|uniref:Lysophospholipase L1-like esterase n=1 Tax=Gracilibacillus halotolerans TaxID=74386 RepID=A0A841RPD2_9BACI|nr:SGNH/GDSL hydrolase family protein [Gracilibacillus halotolerans]MBB6513035.1 lysophospholipase L1-like esterase [Gracilibacillus halotolerans]
MKKKKILLSIAAIAVCVTVALTFITQESINEEIESNLLEEDASEEVSEQQLQDYTQAEPNETEEFGNSVREAVKEALRIFKKDTHIVAIGDSLTQGVGDETGNGGYVGILEQRLLDQNFQVTFDNFGKRGNRTDQLLNRLDDEEIVDSIEKADIVLITIGANDVMKIVRDNFMNLTVEPFNAERDPYGHRLSEILSRISAMNENAKIYLLGFYNPFERYFNDIEALDQIIMGWNNESLEAVNKYEQVDFIPMQDIFNQVNEPILADDNFHPNHEGYQMMADRVLEYLENDLEVVTE